MRDEEEPRHPESAPGDFYVVHGECILCGAPHHAAPELMGWATQDQDGPHCIWKRQPETPEEVEQAVAAVLSSEVGCHRYAGTGPDIIGKIGTSYCDHPELAPPGTKENQLEPDQFGPPPTWREAVVMLGGIVRFLGLRGAVVAIWRELFRKR